MLDIADYVDVKLLANLLEQRKNGFHAMTRAGRHDFRSIFLPFFVARQKRTSREKRIDFWIENSAKFIVAKVLKIFHQNVIDKFRFDDEHARFSHLIKANEV